tara:strand:+ start:4513 stop:4770 length:258 start_codon:yes stop_codon:yes gene_type:complete
MSADMNSVLKRALVAIQETRDANKWEQIINHADKLYEKGEIDQEVVTKIATACRDADRKSRRIQTSNAATAERAEVTKPIGAHVI